MGDNYVVLVSGNNDTFDMELRRTYEGKVIFWRKSKRSGITNSVSRYTHLDAAGNVKMLPITEHVGRKIIERILNKEYFSSCFLFTEEGLKIPDYLLTALKTKSVMEEKFTSTGAKFWYHRDQMLSYREGTGHTVITTHISPESRCNLACPYCSVTYRKVKNRLEMSVIRQYVKNLKSRGLKAVILTGGGEPTLYPHINELLDFLYGENLKVAIITNGTRLHLVRKELLKRLSWMRVSINVFKDWEEKIRVPEWLSGHITIGLSFIYTPLHEHPQFNLLAVLGQIKIMADKIGARYIRLLPNCLLDQKSLLAEHLGLGRIAEKLDDKRFFHQGKLPKVPNAEVCHQSYFRPYLSEEPFPGEITAGSVFPCDSVVLNKDAEYFNERYVVCRPQDILDYLDGRIKANFSPHKHCSGCVFSSTVNMLERFKNQGEEHFEENKNMEVNHVEFV